MKQSRFSDRKDFSILSDSELQESAEQGRLTLEELNVTALNRLFSLEADLVINGGGDTALLRRCAGLLEQKDPAHAITDETHDRLLKNAFSAGIKQTKNLRTLRLPKRAMAAAVCAAVTVFGTLFCGASVTDADIRQYISIVTKMEPGALINADGYTFINGGPSLKFRSVEAFVQSGRTGYLFPTVLPEGCEPMQIHCALSETSDFVLSLTTTDSRVSMAIYRWDSERELNYAHAERYELNGRVFWIYTEKERCCAHFVEDGLYYSFNAPTREDMLMILNSLEKY